MPWGDTSKRNTACIVLTSFCRCMKASIQLDGENLDARIKIGTMLMEMDELDKVSKFHHK
jgi:hypothetical protein